MTSPREKSTSFEPLLFDFDEEPSQVPTSGNESWQPCDLYRPSERAEEEATRLLLLSGLLPGAAPRDIARRLGIRVFEVDLPPEVLGASQRGKNRILLNPSGYPARDEFTIAHELFELAIARQLPERAHEYLCDMAASALILPRGAFLTSALRQQCELPALRRTWRWASYETLATRLAVLMPGVAAAKWIDGRPAWRRCRGNQPLARAEAKALARALRTGRGQAASEDRLALAWRLLDSGRRRFGISLCFPVTGAA